MYFMQCLMIVIWNAFQTDNKWVSIRQTGQKKKSNNGLRSSSNVFEMGTMVCVWEREKEKKNGFVLLLRWSWFVSSIYCDLNSSGVLLSDIEVCFFVVFFSLSSSCPLLLVVGWIFCHRIESIFFYYHEFITSLRLIHGFRMLSHPNVIPSQPRCFLSS